jgi:hypothetical protein
MPFALQVNIYNAAGERVRTLFNGSAQCAPLGVQALPPAIAAGAGLSSLSLNCPLSNGGNAISWNGVNDQGQAVSSGTYYFRLQAVSPFGQISSWIAPVSVLDLPAQSSLTIFNSAGEVVEDVPVGSYAAQLYGISPAKGGLTLSFLDGSTRAFVWNGRNNQGQAVSSGTYIAELVATVPGGMNKVQDFPITWINPGAGGAAAPRAYPNPAQAGSRGPWISYQGSAATASLYNVAGELLAQAADQGGGFIRFNAPPLAAGIYVVDFEGQNAGMTLRSRIKWAVLP